MSSSCPNLCALDGHPPSSPRLSATVKHRSQQELFSGSLQNLRSQQKPSQRAVSGPLRAGFIDWPLAPSVPDMIHGAADAERDLIQDAVWAKVRQSCWPCVQCCLLLHISAGQLMLNHLQRVWDTFASKACSHPLLVIILLLGRQRLLRCLFSCLLQDASVKHPGCETLISCIARCN